MLKSLVEVQKHFRKKDHLEQTQQKLEAMKAKYDIQSDEELIDDERNSQKVDETDDRDNDNDDCSISELSESGMCNLRFTPFIIQPLLSKAIYKCTAMR